MQWPRPSRVAGAIDPGSVWLTRESSAPPRVGVSVPRRPRHLMLGRYRRGRGASGDVRRQGWRRGGAHPQLHSVVAIAMTQHPDHRLRVLLWRLDDEGRPRPSAQHGFTQLSSAVAFQIAALERPGIVRADLMLLLNSSSRAERPESPSRASIAVAGPAGG
jgi:hypothetical protein